MCVSVCTRACVCTSFRLFFAMLPKLVLNPLAQMIPSPQSPVAGIKGLHHCTWLGLWKSDANPTLISPPGNQVDKEWEHTWILAVILRSCSEQSSRNWKCDHPVTKRKSELVTVRTTPCFCVFPSPAQCCVCGRWALYECALEVTELPACWCVSEHRLPQCSAGRRHDGRDSGALSLYLEVFLQ